MTPSEQSIETVRNALRTAEPSQGFDARVCDALLRAANKPQRSMGWLPFAVVTAVVLLIGVSAGVVLVHHPVAAISTTALVTQQPKTKADVREVASVSTGVAQRTAHQPARCKRVVALPHAEVESAVLTHESIPEPPLPLTHQERFLLQIVRHDKSPQLAEYTPDARLRRLHRDAEAYDAFFAPPRPLEGQPLYIQHISGGTQ